jgi:hypothetical protein
MKKRNFMMNNPWEKISKPQKDLKVRRVDHAHPLNLFWAKDHFGSYLLVIEVGSFPEHREMEMPSLEGIELRQLIEEEDSNSDRLVLLLREQSNWQLFYALCSDIISATKSIDQVEKAPEIILGRLVRWQEFLKNKRERLLSEEKIKGLIGELIFFREQLIPKFGPQDALTFWQGPLGHPQDFSVNDTAVEIKAQSGVTAPNIKISSVDQLNTQLDKLYLHVVTLGKSTPDDKRSINLPNLVSDLRFKMQSHSLKAYIDLNDLLLNYGYVDLEDYEKYNYILSSQSTFEVKDGFPRVCENDLLPGITHLTYSISLHSCEGFEGQPDWMRGDYD